MGKVFSITEGLENLGALRTGGQGSVYKARRVGPIITAVKLIPTPVSLEDENDRNYLSFKNEVEKLKRVNLEPNPNVVKILNSGITESGAFPFIEMEYIEGPDLEELLKPPHEKIFTIKETVKLADQLACALNHCHSVGVKHGDIKSNNVKFNIHSGNYVLLDFGLAVLSDEQRRTSMRNAGAIEFMAPEQYEGQMLFQTDVYSFGIILFELLTGQVPFPLSDNGETARNLVRLKHIEEPLPDLLELRKQNIPEGWDEEKKSAEMQVPVWLINIVLTCLKKKPEERYANGMALHEAISAQAISGGTNAELQTENTILKQKLDAKPDVLKAAIARQTLKSYRKGLFFMAALVLLLGVILISDVSHSRSKNRTINELRDSLVTAKEKIVKESAALHRANVRYNRLLKSQQALKNAIEQDSIQRSNVWPFGQNQQDQQDRQDTKPRRRHKFLGLF